MRRREFFTALGGAAVWPFAVRAQQMPVIGVLYSGNSEAFRDDFSAFRDGLAETGLVDGQNVAFEFRMAESHLDRLPALADDLVRRPLSLPETVKAGEVDLVLGALRVAKTRANLCAIRDLTG
jgi:putative ABC transport system substrate-binding protein